jgi:hypothetical protein
VNDLEGRRATVSMTLAAASPPAPFAAPQADVYRERVAHLQEALRRNPNGPEAPEVVRGLIEHGKRCVRPTSLVMTTRN